ncbi:MAG: class I SAM-dependent methyltransferase [Oscillospiraceae bacterium]|nr:class I SAM-dependent methyltransferase [Oscillospiraceae bacterium]
MFNAYEHGILVSPVTRKMLRREGDKLHTLDHTESYPVVNDVPILLTGGASADWHREIMEVLLWQFPEKISELYTKLDWSKSPSDVYIQYIGDLLKDKAGIMSAIRSYSQESTDKWIIRDNGAGPLTPDVIAAFERRNSKKFARATVKSARHNGIKKWAKHLPKYVELVHRSNPSFIAEISTGSGFGTAAVADKLSPGCTMFTVDIGFDCHGNSVSIAKHLKISDKLLPVCANFWHLPFKSESMDVVCSHFGLDESRENGRTLAEIARVLKKGGRFVNVSRSDASQRQFDLFEPFGFTREETVGLMKVARLYGDTKSLEEECTAYGLTPRESFEFHSSGARTRRVTVSVMVRE